MFWRLAELFGGVTGALEATNKQLLAVPGMKRNFLDKESSASFYRDQATLELERLNKLGGEAVIFEDSAYPELLGHISDPPPVLYVLGEKQLLNTHFLAIVGSRAATTYGSRIAFSLARELADSGYGVISGMALGIDREAHLGTLSVGGITAAVLGCGLNVIYPQLNSNIYKEIRRQGVLVTEYPLGTRPDGFRFPARNRIIAGMSQGVIVVEAAKRSGSLITAQLALDAGREIFAVPGQVDSSKSVGTHLLLQQGAKLVQNGNDVMEEVSQMVSGKPNKQQKSSQLIKNLDPDARLLLQYVDSYPCQRDGLTDKTGLPIWRVSELLLLLELEGILEVLPGNQVRRVDGYEPN